MAEYDDRNKQVCVFHMSPHHKSTAVFNDETTVIQSVGIVYMGKNCGLESGKFVYM